MNLCKISSCHKSICRACFVIRAEKLFGFLFKKLWRSKIVFGIDVYTSRSNKLLLLLTSTKKWRSIFTCAYTLIKKLRAMLQSTAFWGEISTKYRSLLISLHTVERGYSKQQQSRAFKLVNTVFAHITICYR